MGQGKENFVKVRTGKLVWHQVGEEVMLLDLISSNCLALNRTGAALWPLLLAGCRRGDLPLELMERFGIDDITAQRDAEKFLESLACFGILEESHG
jgi:Coenzyme PQQ synthesis protein D (PqqD)